MIKVTLLAFWSENILMNNTTSKDYKVWKTPATATKYLEGMRAAIPLAGEQIDCLLRLIGLSQSQVNNFLDLGCGDGILGRAISSVYPLAQGTFLDMSETMLEAAKNKVVSEQTKVNFILEDLASSTWLERITPQSPFDVIVSGFAIHHLPDARKKELYQEIFSLLQPGGIFLNLEHVSSLSVLGEKSFDELFIDHLYAYHQSKGSQQSRQEIDIEYYNRADKTANILASVELQCNWLRDLGFVEVDCFMKLFEIALFGGVKPPHQ